MQVRTNQEGFQPFESKSLSLWPFSSSVGQGPCEFFVLGPIRQSIFHQDSLFVFVFFIAVISSALSNKHILTCFL